MIEAEYGEELDIEIQTLTKQNAYYLEKFRCGNKEMDAYFREEAVDDQTAVTYLFLDLGEQRAFACATASCSGVFVGSEGIRISNNYPAMEIEYFAVDEDYRHILFTEGKDWTLSKFALYYMIDRLRAISQKHIGARKIVLYALKGKTDFYKDCKFKTFGEHMPGVEEIEAKGYVPMYFDLWKDRLKGKTA